MNKCLMIIDPQKDFTSPIGYYAEKHKDISLILEAKRNINKLLQKIDENIYVIIVYSDYYENQFGQNVSMCIPNTQGYEIDIDKKDTYFYFPKKEHSAFSSYDLKQFLISNNITEIYLAGFLAEYCVKASAIGAIQNNFNLVLLMDCIGTGDDVKIRIDTLINEVTELGGKISKMNTVF